MKIRRDVEQEKSQLDMTSMIDVVFLLLVFFVMTFKIVELEGDFSIHMPLAGTSNSVSDPTDLPLKVRLRADADGKLASMSLEGIDLGTDFTKLRTNVIQLVGTDGPAEGDEGPEIEVDTDYNLRYAHVIEAITAVSGYKDGDQVVKLVEKIKFAKPRR
ncbi:biopolymer transporter ExbD [Stieleria varia]|uniref:Biopolymer transport protein ExbD/TolR n=1 Tax=Stieleria varia TaxID=2528005 RepID=A0A5C6B9J7_9BACT|nr:biopolymer transporter ExbD [Stieleria varia]TWU07936.1 Biopolymer transport protein ExbD/TolR [Stieleria varia]